MLTLSELYDEMLRLSRQLNAAIDHMTQAAHDHAQADNEYRMARAKAWLNAFIRCIPRIYLLAIQQ